MFDGHHSQFPVLYGSCDFSEVQFLFWILLMAEVFPLEFAEVQSSHFQDSNVQALCFIFEKKNTWFTGKSGCTIDYCKEGSSQNRTFLYLSKLCRFYA